MENVDSIHSVGESFNHNTSVCAGVQVIHGGGANKMCKGVYACSECKKHFGNRHILELHLQVHQANRQRRQKTSISEEISVIIADTTSKNCVSRKDALPLNTETKIEDSKSNQNLLPAKKLIGLTKVRFEDCLRCDACSCIYLDETDYHKHMKNFHNQNARKKTRVRTKKVCISCCKNCKCNGNHIDQSPKKQITDTHLHHNIKDRWSKLMQGTLSTDSEKCSIEDIKTEPDDGDDTFDYSHLLSQVEVRIKTEPMEDLEHDNQCSE